MSEFLSDNDFLLFSKIIYEKSGIHFSDTNRCILESRLKERLKNAKIDSLQDYHALIQRDHEEMKILLDSVTTNLTRFFRNTSHFNALEKHILPDIIENRKKSGINRIRIWSAGCSTGEEPYSIAIILKERLPRDFAPEIIASDLSLKSLMTAKEGFYPESRIGGVPEHYLGKYFEKKKEGYQIRSDIKDMVKFDYHNLKYDSGLRNLDIIFCRNVIIYFDTEAQKAVINRFWKALKSHSYLFIGHSESLFGMNTQFKFVKTDWCTLYGKELNNGQG